MTYTRTFTLEERALEAMCAQPPQQVRVTNGGMVGVICEIYPSVVKFNTRRVCVLETIGRRRHHIDLEYGTLEYL